MKKSVAIYLAGTIKKGHEKADETYWTDEDLSLLRQKLSDFHISFLNPALRSDDLSDSVSVFGRDMLQVFSADVVFVDARDRRGLGVGAEMMWAKLNNRPVIIWAPKETHYHKSKATLLGVEVDNFIHPFVVGLSDKIVETLEEGAAWIASHVSSETKSIKGRESIENAIEHYKATQLEKDLPMQQLLRACAHLHSRVK